VEGAIEGATDTGVSAVRELDACTQAANDEESKLPGCPPGSAYAQFNKALQVCGQILPRYFVLLGDPQRQ
jgi:hypothetical protein